MFKEYTAWISMKERCYNPRNIRYKSYGARGIKVCDAWLHDYEAFLHYVGPAPSPKHSIDRIDFNGNYAPGNVRWATTKEQARNSSNATFIEFNGERKSIADWADAMGLSPFSISCRLRRGWSAERALTTPPVDPKKPVIWQNESHTLPEWAIILGIKRSTLQMRIGAYKWSVDKAFTTPVHC